MDEVKGTIFIAMQTKDLKEIRLFLIGLLKQQGKIFKIDSDTETQFGVSGTIETMQGKKKVDGIYFGSVVNKAKDIRFYFFPLYTHKEQLEGIVTGQLKKYLKGKTCFHIKSLDDDIRKGLNDLVTQGVKLYQKDGLLEKYRL